MGLDHLLDLFLHRVEVKACRILHRRIVNGGQGELRYRLLNHNKAPEFARHEVHSVAPGTGEGTLPAEGREAFERILPEVGDRGHVGVDLLTRPAIWLLQELKLEIIDANGTELGAAEVEQLVARRRSFAFEQSQLIEAVEVVFVRAVPKFRTLEKLIGDVRGSGCRHQRGEPIEAGEKTVLHGTGLGWTGRRGIGGTP